LKGTDFTTYARTKKNVTEPGGATASRKKNLSSRGGDEDRKGVTSNCETNGPCNEGLEGSQRSVSSGVVHCPWGGKVRILLIYLGSIQQLTVLFKTLNGGGKKLRGEKIAAVDCFESSHWRLSPPQSARCNE